MSANAPLAAPHDISAKRTTAGADDRPAAVRILQARQGVIAIANDTSSKDRSPILRLRHLHRRFGSFEALVSLDLDVYAGELFTLLGPSGCGKTTTLRLVAGLDYPDAGEIWFDDRLIVGTHNGTAVPPHQRNMGMVFQSYAIWPHMTVFENVAYPLRARRVSRQEIDRRVGQALSRVGLSGLEDRPGPALSGGQQQRVAMARALVYEPKLLLLDEPFSNLDAKLREQMRAEIRKLLKGLGITVLLVTHDQLEALALSDRIAVMAGGRAEQVGSAVEVYDTPNNPFVRDFLGRVVLLPGAITELASDGQARVSVFRDAACREAAQFRAACAASSGLRVGQNVVVSIRPEQIGVTPLADERDTPPIGENRALGTIETLMFAGDRHEARFRTGDSAFVAYLPRNQSWREGQKVILDFPPQELSVWPA